MAVRKLEGKNKDAGGKPAEEGKGRKPRMDVLQAIVRRRSGFNFGESDAQDLVVESIPMSKLNTFRDVFADSTTYREELETSDANKGRRKKKS